MGIQGGNRLLVFNDRDAHNCDMLRSQTIVAGPGNTETIIPHVTFTGGWTN